MPNPHSSPCKICHPVKNQNGFFPDKDTFGVEAVLAVAGHAHLVQYIAGTGSGGELRSIGEGKAIYANGQIVQMIPKEFGADCVTPENMLQTMDANGVEKAVLLQGNFYGFQNHYTYEAVQKYPNRFVGAASYDPWFRDRDGIRKFLFEELGFRIEKFEISTGSGLMSSHPTFELDGEVLQEACRYAENKGHVFVIDIGKCHSESWQVTALRNLAMWHPNMKFVVCHLLAPAPGDGDALKMALEMLRLPNVWFDLSSLIHNSRGAADPFKRAMGFILMARDLVGADRLLFGTDYPSALKEETYETYVNFLQKEEKLTEEEKTHIFYGNAEQVFFS